MVGTPLQLMTSTNIGKVRTVKLLALSRFPTSIFIGARCCVASLPVFFLAVLWRLIGLSSCRNSFDYRKVPYIFYASITPCSDLRVPTHAFAATAALSVYATTHAPGICVMTNPIQSKPRFLVSPCEMPSLARMVVKHAKRFHVGSSALL